MTAGIVLLVALILLLVVRVRCEERIQHEAVSAGVVVRACVQRVAAEGGDVSRGNAVMREMLGHAFAMRASGFVAQRARAACGELALEEIVLQRQGSQRQVRPRRIAAGHESGEAEMLSFAQVEMERLTTRLALMEKAGIVLLCKT